MSERVHSKLAEGGKLGNCNYFEIIINKSNVVGCNHQPTGYDLLLKKFFRSFHDMMPILHKHWPAILCAIGIKNDRY